MNIVSVFATPAALFLPSHSKSISIGKIAFFGMIFTTFFLFTAGYCFPGGAIHYPYWAEAIMHGKTLPPDFAQREVGFPLLYILSGFTFSHSFIGLTLILAVFAVLMSVLVYLCLVDCSPAIAFYAGLACIFSLAPFTYLKFFYPDQAYMFFNLLAVMLLIKFIQSKSEYKWLYFFTLVSLMASFTRTAGNLMYPVLLVIAYLSAKGSLRHYLSCILIFVLGVGMYQWHRYEIFDTRHQPTVPSGKGMQILYSTYLYLGDFGVRLSPDFGPNTKRLFEKMRENLGTDVRHSALIQTAAGSTPPDFMEKYVYPYTPDELIEKVATEPNEEYYWDVVYAADTNNDKFFLDVAKEIMIAEPWYVVQYTARNFWHALFDPGYATTRYNTAGFIHTGMEYPPASPSWGVYSADSASTFGSRADEELKYFPLKTTPTFIQTLFSKINIFYYKYFNKYVMVTSVLMVFAWIAAIMGILAKIFPHIRFLQMKGKINLTKLSGPIIIASAMVLYEDLLTSLFCQPLYRYFHMTEPLRMVVSAFGLIFLVGVLSLCTPLMFSNSILRMNGIVANIQKNDLVNSYFSRRRKQWIFLLMSINIILFAWWVSSMIAHTIP